MLFGLWWHDLRDMFITWLHTTFTHVVSAWLCLLWAGPWGMLPAFAHAYWVGGPWGLWTVLIVGLVVAQGAESRAHMPHQRKDLPVATLTAAHLSGLCLASILWGPILGSSTYVGLIGRHFPYHPEDVFGYLAYRMLARLFRGLTVVAAGGFTVFFIFARG